MNSVTPSELSLDDVEKYQAHIDEEMEKLKTKLQESVLGLLARAVLDTPGLNSIIVYGYTPRFNDGDPCYHSQSGPYLNGFDRYGDRSVDSDEDESQNKEWGYGVENAAFDRVARLVNNLSEGLQLLFDTDWALHIKRLEDGTVGWETCPYDCGH